MKSLGVILAGGNNHRLEKLTSTSGRATAAMPIGGGYCAIDFSLSNMTNSGIRKVAVMVQFNSGSLHNHLSSSKWWDLGRKKGGLFVYSPYLSGLESPFYRGTSNAMYQNIKFFLKSNEEYVVITSGDSIYKADFDDFLNYHIEKGNDITVAYKKAGGLDPRQFGVIELDDEENILDFEEKPLETSLDNISLGIYAISRKLLIGLLETTNKEGRYDFVRDIVIRYRKVLKLGGYPFKGYWRSLGSIKAYYDTNMDFLSKDVRDYFTKEPPFIVTKPRDVPPAKYNNGAEARGSLIGGGSILNGYVENSVLFSNIYVGENTFIKNSIIMDKVHIGNNCVLENTIIDKEVNIRDNTKIIGTVNQPAIVDKGKTI